jgi:hypothetical protein
MSICLGWALTLLYSFVIWSVAFVVVNLVLAALWSTISFVIDKAKSYHREAQRAEVDQLD